MRSTHNLKKNSCWFWCLLSKSAELSKPWGRFIQILCVSQIFRTLLSQDFSFYIRAFDWSQIQQPILRLWILNYYECFHELDKQTRLIKLVLISQKITKFGFVIVFFWLVSKTPLNCDFLTWSIYNFVYEKKFWTKEFWLTKVPTPYKSLQLFTVSWQKSIFWHALTCGLSIRKSMTSVMGCICFGRTKLAWFLPKSDQVSRKFCSLFLNYRTDKNWANFDKIKGF